MVSKPPFLIRRWALVVSDEFGILDTPETTDFPKRHRLVQNVRLTAVNESRTTTLGKGGRKEGKQFRTSQVRMMGPVFR